MSLTLVAVYGLEPSIRAQRVLNSASVISVVQQRAVAGAVAFAEVKGTLHLAASSGRARMSWTVSVCKDARTHGGIVQVAEVVATDEGLVRLDQLERIERRAHSEGHVALHDPSAEASALHDQRAMKPGNGPRRGRRRCAPGTAAAHRGARWRSRSF